MANTGMPGFMTYRETALIFRLLSDEDAAQAIKAACTYYLTGKEIQVSEQAGEVFSVMKASIDRDFSKYQEKSEKSRKAAHKSWENRR